MECFLELLGMLRVVCGAPMQPCFAIRLLQVSRDIWRVPPCAPKTCAARPIFARVVGELPAADPRAHEAKC